MMDVIVTDKAPAAIGPYSQGFVCNGMVYTSGQIPLDPETENLVEASIEAQAHQACKNVGKILEACGSDFSKVVKTTCYLSDLKNFVKFNEIYAQYFTGKPARSCVEVSALPKGALVEIEAIAEK